MKKHHYLIFLSLLFISCFLSNYESERIISPSGKFEIKATVNRTNKSINNYADVVIHIFDKNNNEISKINTKAGDANKWAIGWTKYGDTIVLQSSDIGNKSWVLQKIKPVEIIVTDKLNERAKFLYNQKYN